MRQFLTLVRLFWQQLIRRKSLWVVVTLVGIVLLVNVLVASQMKHMLDNGVRYDIATRRASASLGEYAAQVRQGAVFLALIVAALVAPGSRKDGTTQFVLTLSVGRARLALAQFGALALFVFLSTLLVHAGFMVAAYRLGSLSWPEALFAWIPFLLLLLVASAASFSLSLTRPALVVYGVLLGVPRLLLPLLAGWIASWTTATSLELRMAGARFVDNLLLLFPRSEQFASWPRILLEIPSRPPIPSLGFEVLHELAAIALWTTLGLWAYYRHDFGSRMPTR